MTLPKEILDALSLSAGDKVDSIPMENGNYAMVQATRSVMELKGIIQEPDRSVTLKEMDDAIAAGAAGK